MRKSSFLIHFFIGGHFGICLEIIENLVDVHSIFETFSCFNINIVSDILDFVHSEVIKKTSQSVLIKLFLVVSSLFNLNILKAAFIFKSKQSL